MFCLQRAFIPHVLATRELTQLTAFLRHVNEAAQNHAPSGPLNLGPHAQDHAPRGPLNLGPYESLYERFKQQHRSDADFGTKLKELKAEKKPRHVLTSHGVVYVARLIDRLEECKKRKRLMSGAESTAGGADEPSCTEADCAAAGPNLSRCDEHAKKLRLQFQDITPEIVEDLSKTDWIGRLIFLIQASWMMVQTVARCATKLPITLLELHAASHAAVAAVQYLIWWGKPIDMVVMTPLTLTAEQYQRMLTEKTEEVTNHSRFDPDYSQIIQKFVPSPASQPSSSEQSSEATEQNGVQTSSGDNAANTPDQANPDKALSKFINAMRKWWSDLVPDLEKLSGSTTGETANYFTSRATLGKEGYKHLTSDVRVTIRDPCKGITLAILTLILSWYRWPLKAVAWFTMALFYSAIHVVAWKWHFPTHTEQVLWHVCTLITTCSMAALAILALLATVYSCFRKLSFKWSADKTIEKNKLYWAFAVVFRSDEILTVFHTILRMTGVSVGIGAAPWLLARLFIAVESLISIRNVAKGTYTTLKWSNLIPHL
ncbi:hypothetical protein BDZ91DRAFT_362712 [Kalaharituber pfeilii]|nr:hypothetical protein BDZ91DRAFT_362712 [Kalaharituber pfeilii]